MENIFILPTSKESRLLQSLTVMELLDKEWLSPIGNVNRNIYITSDEEIKEGNWCLDLYDQRWKLQDNKLVAFDNTGVKRFSTDNIKGHQCKKIILTTDPDLIKDGVQAINDEFLKWIVKNPSCKFIKIESNKCLVKRGGCDCSEMDMSCQCLGYIIIIPKEELSSKLHIGEEVDESYPEAFRKDETLEEAAKKLFGNLETGTGAERKRIWLNGVKWQQERMYTKEDMKQAFLDGLFYSSGDTVENAIEEWFENFKKH